jgi:hypothetical protein
MNLEQLQKRHPAVYKAVVEAGRQREHDRICGHVTLGTKSGDAAAMIAFIRSGAQLTPAITSHYMAAGINRADVRARQAESNEAEAVLENVATPKGAHTDEFGEAVRDRLTKLLGVGEAGVGDLEGIE